MLHVFWFVIFLLFAHSVYGQTKIISSDEMQLIKIKENVDFFNSYLLVFTKVKKSNEAKNESPVSSKSTASDDYYFDESMLLGTSLSDTIIGRFNHPGQVALGTYDVDVFFNNVFLDRQQIEFINVDGFSEPCVPRELLENAGLLTSAINPEKRDAQCLVMQRDVKSATTKFDLSNLRLDILIPQTYTKVLGRGYVDENLLSKGITAAFFNYNVNHFRTQRKNSSELESSYAGINAGINFGLWRFRNQSNINSSRQSGTHYHNIRTYLQRALPSIRSELTIGDSFTSGRLFSGLGYRGFELRSDDRMLPSSLRGYAPTIRGSAQSNARVRVYQNGVEIYETTVPPGPFVISDLYPTSYNGDLNVIVTEADGRQFSFSVPFSAVPNSLREGQSRYTISGGQARQLLTNKPKFVEAVYEYGLNNSITVNGGVRATNGYQAFVLGGVYSNFLGAFGFDVTQSNSKFVTRKESGQLYRLNYSRSIDTTSTILNLAFYHYSSMGYRDINDYILNANNNNLPADVNLLNRQHNRFEVSINQSLTKWGSVYLSGSSQSYWGASGHDTQYQFGYSKVFNNSLSLDISLSRQRTLILENTNNQVSPLQNVFMISLSMPLGESVYSPTISLSNTSITGGDRLLQATLSGVTGAKQSLAYGLSAAQNQKSKDTIIGASLQKSFPKVSIAGSATRGPDFWQESLSARGSFLIHRGGITFGPFLTDTFALIEAKGAQGAHLVNGQASEIDADGFALVPSLVPYQYNSISLDPDGMNPNAELVGGIQKIAPFAGAAVKVVFKVSQGQAVLIDTQLDESTQIIPMGAQALDEKNNEIGMVGQNGQLYVRLNQKKGNILVRWGDSIAQQCQIEYDINSLPKDSIIARIKGICKSQNPTLPSAEAQSALPIQSIQAEH